MMRPSGPIPQACNAAMALDRPAAVDRPDAPAPSVLRNVSAYRFWLAFIRRSARVDSGGDRWLMNGAPCGGGGASLMSSMSTAGPRTSMPWAISVVRNAFTKNWVGLSTETSRETGGAPSGTAPVRRRRGLPGSRYAETAAGRSAADVVSELSTTSPPLVGETVTPAQSPAATPGPTVTRTAFSLYCSALTPAA